VNLTLLRMGPKRFILDTNVNCSILLKTGNIHRSKKQGAFA